MSLPRIAITMGDPAGVGPEICLDLLADEAVSSYCVPIVFGDRAVLESCAEKTGKPIPTSFCDEHEIKSVRVPSVFQIDSIGLNDFEPGVINAATGRAAYTYITKAIDIALAGSVGGVTTAPINKEALSRAGISQPGHTEIFAERCGSERYCMMLTSEIITCSLVTIHVGYDQVPGMLTKERILEVIELTRDAMTRIRGREPRLVVCGLNPHAGEHGLFGNREEEEIILPAIEAARRSGATVEGPLPPDTAFLKGRRAETDAYVCMYHDQGLIPLKALAFDEAINTTLGLPIVRTSVDHGTALDIAWQGKANCQSLIEAVRLAAQMSPSPE